MATSTRVRGNVNPVLTFKIGAAAAASYADDTKKIGLTSEDKDGKDLTFAEAAAGVGLDYTLKITAITSFDAGSLWGYLWDNAGSTATVKYGPKGNAAASTTQPHFTFDVVLRRPDIETESDVSGKTGAEFEIELTVVTAVTKVTA